jgi:ClpP class serine protease
MIRRSTHPPQRFDRHGFLAVDPRAFFELFIPPSSRANVRCGSVEVVEISGPLVQRDEMWCDSYEAIRARFTAALASDATAIVLRFDSPGGDASGCFETARALRTEALAARKPLYVYIDKACSAAYALASAATHGIGIGDTCCAGSIGVLSSRPDYTAQNTAAGVRYAFVVSGSRKLDGNPDFPITEAEIAETQRHVDSLAVKFFALLEENRLQLSAASVASFDGAVFYGEDAVANGLADAVLTFDEMLAGASEGKAFSMKTEYDTARASLEKVAKGNDANAAAAKRALAAMAESEPPKEEPDGDEEPSSEEPDGDEPKEESEDDDKQAASTTAMDDEPPADKKPKSEGAGASAQAAATETEISLAAKVQRLEAAEAARKDASTRRALLAKRPDFGPEVRAVLSKAPIETLREAVKTWPKSKAPAPKPKAATTVPATRAEGQTDVEVPGGTKAPRVATRHSPDADELDERMGLRAPRLGCRRDGSTLYFGVLNAEVVDAKDA